MRKWHYYRPRLIYYHDINQPLSFDSLYNYKRINPLGGLTYDNLALIRSFAGSESE
jgi:hypothetical protein